MLEIYTLGWSVDRSFKNYDTDHHRKEISLLKLKYCAVVTAIYEQNGELRQTTNEI